MARSTTARVRRECARAGVASRLERLRIEHGLSQAQCVALLGLKSTTQWGYFENPDHPASLSLADIEIIGETYPEFAQMLLAGSVGLLGMRMVPAEQAQAVLDDQAAIGRLTAELGAVLQEETEAQRDGFYDATEARRLKKRYAAIERAAASRGARMDEAEQARADGVRAPLKAV